MGPQLRKPGWLLTAVNVNLTKRLVAAKRRDRRPDKSVTQLIRPKNCGACKHDFFSFSLRNILLCQHSLHSGCISLPFILSTLSVFVNRAIKVNVYTSLLRNGRQLIQLECLQIRLRLKQRTISRQRLRITSMLH